MKYALSGYPSELSFSGRTLSGTPASSGTHSLRYTVTDSDATNPDSAGEDFDLVIAPDRVPSCPGIGVQRGTVNVQGTWTLAAASGGDGTLRHSYRNLPDGLSWSGTVVSGRPSMKQTKSVTYTATDSDVERSDSCTSTFNFEIGDDGGGGGGGGKSVPVLPDVLPDQYGAVGETVMGRLVQATGGDGNLTYTAAPLPDGLRFEADRHIRGTPSAAARTETVTYVVTDADGDRDSGTFKFFILKLPAVENQEGMVGEDLNIELPAAVDGKAPYTYTVSARPTNTSFVVSDTERKITGVPTVAETLTITYEVTDANRLTVSVEFEVVIRAALIFVKAVPDVMDGTVGIGFLEPLPLASGGKPPYTYEFNAEDLHDGLVWFDKTPAISGTPTEAGTRMMRWTARDKNGAELTAEFEIVIVKPPTVLKPGLEILWRSGDSLPNETRWLDSSVDWKVLEVLGIEIRHPTDDVIPGTVQAPYDAYEFRLTVPRSSGVDVLASDRKAPCVYPRSGSTTTDWLSVRNDSGVRSHVFLGRCGRGDGVTEIEFEARVKGDNSPVEVELNLVPKVALHHADEEIVYYECGAQPGGLDGIDVTDVISGAVSRWNGVNAGVKFKEYSPDPPPDPPLATGICSFAKKDGMLKIGGASDTEMMAYCKSGSAIACVSWSATGSHFGTQSFLYREVLGRGRSWSTNKDDSMDSEEDYVYMPVVFMHELGHAAGLAHSPDKSAAMYKWEQDDVQDLTSDDIAAMKALYKDHTAH